MFDAARSAAHPGKVMVLAYGDHGLEPTPADEVTEIPVFPVGPGNTAIPASVRFLASRRGVSYAARRLTGIRTKGRAFPLVTWRDANGERHSCCICNEADANDTIFQSLSPTSKIRLLRVAARREAQS